VSSQNRPDRHLLDGCVSTRNRKVVGSNPTSGSKLLVRALQCSTCLGPVNDFVDPPTQIDQRDSLLFVLVGYDHPDQQSRARWPPPFELVANHAQVHADGQPEFGQVLVEDRCACRRRRRGRSVRRESRWFASPSGAGGLGCCGHTDVQDQL
jgi:hypothetical protein